MNALIGHVGQQQLVGFFLVLARISPLFVVAPLFSSTMLPGRVKGIAAVGLAIGLAPLATHGQRIALDIPTVGVLILKEITVGLAFSYAIAAVFAAVSVAGSFLDALIGFSYGSLVDPLTGNQGTVLSQLYSLFGVMVFITIGGDSWVVHGIANTYDLVPLASMPALGSLVAGTEHAFTTVFVSAVELAAPVMIALIVTDAGFGVVSKVVPQLNVFAVGFPAKILIGFLIIGTSLPFAAGWIGNQLQVSVRDALDSLHVV